MLDLLLATLIALPAGPAGTQADLGSAYRTLRGGNFAAARAAFRKIAGTNAATPAVLAQLFFIDRRLHRDSEAIDFGRRYLQRRPNDDRFRLNLAYALENVQSTEADQLFKTLESSRDDSVAKVARAQLRAERAPSSVPNPPLADAYVRLQHGDLSGAIADLQRHLAAHPGDASVLLQLAYTQAAAGDHGGSLASIERYLTLNPADELGQLQRAYELEATQQFDAASLLLTKLSASSDPTVSEKAQKALADASAADPAAASAYQKIQSGDPAGAAADLQQHLARFANDSTAWLNLAFAQAISGDKTSSLQSLDQYLQLQPEDQKAKLQEAYDLDSLGRHKDARSIYKSLAMSPDAGISSQARLQLQNSEEGKPFSPAAQLWLTYDSHFKDGFINTQSYLRSNGGIIQPYGVFRFSDDTRSTSGPVPTIYNDNAATVGVGLRTELAAGAHLYLEGGSHFDLITQSAIPAFRLGFGYYHLFGPLAAANTAFDFDVSHYSYYAGDTIAYGSLLHDTPIGPHFDFLIGSNFGLDAQDRYYNNFGELSGAFQMSFSSFRFNLSEVFGKYLRGTEMPAKTTYWSTRPRLIYNVKF